MINEKPRYDFHKIISNSTSRFDVSDTQTSVGYGIYLYYKVYLRVTQEVSNRMQTASLVDMARKRRLSTLERYCCRLLQPPLRQTYLRTPTLFVRPTKNFPDFHICKRRVRRSRLLYVSNHIGDLTGRLLIILFPSLSAPEFNTFC